MEMTTLQKKFTCQEYFELEVDTDKRFEFKDGEVFPIVDETRKHTEICSNMAKCVANHFRPIGGDVFKTSIKIELESENYYIYPDVVLTIDKEDNDAYVVKMPVLVVEVLSKYTDTYDRSVKLHQYIKIKSLRYYLLVSQTQPYVEVYGRTSEEAVFTYTVYEGIEDTIKLPALEFELPMSEVYKYIEFVNEA